jgi:hypothetical protein
MKIREIDLNTLNISETDYDSYGSYGNTDDDTTIVDDTDYSMEGIFRFVIDNY